MNQQPVGHEWLKRHFNLSNYILTHSSYIGSNNSIDLTSKGNVEQTYHPKYRVAENTPLNHLEFSLKYDDFSLDFLKAVFDRIPDLQIEAYVAASPASKYARKIGFLYEFVTGRQLTLSKPVSGDRKSTRLNSSHG